jgi:hypothetical protein
MRNKQPLSKPGHGDCIRGKQEHKAHRRVGYSKAAWSPQGDHAALLRAGPVRFVAAKLFATLPGSSGIGYLPLTPTDRCRTETSHTHCVRLSGNLFS